MADESVQTGKVKWFSQEKGYGFITTNNGGGDIFIHAKELERAGIVTGLREGETVSFKPGKGPKGVFATDIRLGGR